MTAGGFERQVRQLLEVGLESVSARACIERALADSRVGPWLAGVEDRPLDLIAVGKAAESMTSAFLEQCADRCSPSRALVVSPQAPNELTPRDRAVAVTHLTSEHPLPGPGGERAAATVEKWVESGGGRDLVFLLSGGASSLLPAPAPGFALEDKVRWSDRLMRAGADIQQVNTVRTQMSRLKGGRLAARSRYGRVLVFVISDVVGDELTFVGSGPWFPSAASGARAAAAVRSVLSRDRDRSAAVPSDLGEAVPESVEAFIRALEATPDPSPADDPCFEGVEHLICGSGSTALDVMLRSASSTIEGSSSETWGALVSGEAREVAARLVASILEAPTGESPGPRLWLGSGETTVTVRGDGIGGRNQELALAFALEWERKTRQTRSSAPVEFVFASLGTDGRDGPTPVAGALADQGTLAAMRAAGVDPQAALERNDSHAALDAVGATIVTGPTGTNVGDLMVCAVGSPAD